MAAGKSYSPWVKLGRAGSDPVSPGSYGGWVKMRKPPRSYPTTAQQRAIGNKGRQMGKECKGKSGADFRDCRHKILA